MTYPPTLRAASAAIRQQTLTPLELLTDCLEQINRFEAELRAWVMVDQAEAMQSAERLTQELAAGHWRGPLHGIPIGIKDIVDVAGLPTLNGSRLSDTRPATADATIVARLRAAGAVILGKTVTTEFACFDPPPTRNPWNLACTPGGSSSGSAAALAVGMCLGAIGSQTGGSITRPASYCGVAGCKPTFGRVSRHGVAPVSFHFDHVGPMARTAADCALLLEVMAGEDPQDSACAPQNPWYSEDGLALSRSPRLGVIRDYFFDLAAGEGVAAADRALETLRGRGATIVELSLPSRFDKAHAMHRRIMAAEAAEVHRRQFHERRDGYGPNMAALLEEGLPTSPADYQEALRCQARFANTMAGILQGVDALAIPSTPAAAPSLDSTGDPRFNSPWSFAHVPTVSIPCGLDSAGMPLGLQFVGSAWSESRLLATAAWCEQKIDFRAEPPLLAQAAEGARR